MNWEIEPKASFFNKASQNSFEQNMSWARLAKNSKQQRPSIIVGYVEGMNVNAFADLYEGQFYIGIDQALMVTIQELAYFCFAQQNFFPEIGDASIETSPKPLNNHGAGMWLLDHTHQGETSIPESAHDIMPKDVQRSVMATYLSLLMARFVWFHELAHVTNGHLDYICTKGWSSELNEVDEVRGLNLAEQDSSKELHEQFDILKCFEFDADQSAFIGTCYIQLNEMENIEGIAAIDLRTRLKLACFGAYAMTWLFEEYQNYHDTKHRYIHPKPYERLKNLFNVAANVIAPTNDGFAELNDEVIQQFDNIKAVIPTIHKVDDLKNKPLGHEDLLASLKIELEQYAYEPET